MPKEPAPAIRAGNRYQVLVEKVFFDHYRPNAIEVVFDRNEFVAGAKELGIELPKNIGDVIYSFRYRVPLPAKIVAKQPKGLEWTIDGIGKARYAFRLVGINRIVPNPNLVTVRIPDATPEIISAYALSDEQALLAIVRYNRLIDIFLGIAAYSLQSHLRTYVNGIGQIEIDEIYVGVDRGGRQFIVPVQAKGGTDKLGGTQAKQDIACCTAKFPDLICRAISAQFMEGDIIALFELTLEDGAVKIVNEVHYMLVPADKISATELAAYRRRKS
jgi:hypothetical protein